jgi:predicted RNase H-like nuclease
VFIFSYTLESSGFSEQHKKKVSKSLTHFHKYLIKALLLRVKYAQKILSAPRKQENTKNTDVGCL